MKLLGNLKPLFVRLDKKLPAAFHVTSFKYHLSSVYVRISSITNSINTTAANIIAATTA